MYWHCLQTINWSDHGKLQFPWCLILAGQSWLTAVCVCVRVHHDLQGVMYGVWSLNVKTVGQRTATWSSLLKNCQLMRQSFFNELSLAAWAERERLPLFSVLERERDCTMVREGKTFLESIESRVWGKRAKEEKEAVCSKTGYCLNNYDGRTNTSNCYRNTDTMHHAMPPLNCQFHQIHCTQYKLDPLWYWANRSSH